MSFNGNKLNEGNKQATYILVLIEKVTWSQSLNGKQKLTLRSDGSRDVTR